MASRLVWPSRRPLAGSSPTAGRSCRAAPTGSSWAGNQIAIKRETDRIWPVILRSDLMFRCDTDRTKPALWEYSVGENAWRLVDIPPMTEVAPRQRASQNRAMVYDAKRDLVLLVLGSGGDSGQSAVFAMRYRRTQAGSGAATAANFKIPAVTGAITVDGRLDEPFWRDAPGAGLPSSTSESPHDSPAPSALSSGRGSDPGSAGHQRPRRPARGAQARHSAIPPALRSNWLSTARTDRIGS